MDFLYSFTKTFLIEHQESKIATWSHSSLDFLFYSDLVFTLLSKTVYCQVGWSLMIA